MGGISPKGSNGNMTNFKQSLESYLLGTYYAQLQLCTCSVF